MKTFLRILSVICLISWMGLIFYLSAQTAAESSSVSGSVIKMFAEKFYPEFQTLGELEKQSLIESLQDIVRTLAHFGIYMGLGFFAFLSFVSYVTVKFKTRLFCMFWVCAVYAMSDEIHQNFVKGRSMQLIDIAIDCLGILTALIICSLFVFLIRPLWRKVRFKDKNKELVTLTNELYQKLDDSLCLQKQMEDEITRYKKMGEVKKQEQPIAVVEECKGQKKADFSEDFEFASSIIGKTVVEATKACNELTFQNQTNERLELVNLILGRTEVLKSEVLKILNSETDLETKKALMISEQTSAFDYFNSIKAQIG